MTKPDQGWDVFISHASEDRDFVMSLTRALERRDLAVWVDYQVFVAGDSIRGRIDEGLANSRFGVLVVSQAFLTKKWPRRELSGMVARHMDKRFRLIPVWHGVNEQLVSDSSRILADRAAIDSLVGADEAAKRILRAIRRHDDGGEMMELAVEYTDIKEHDDSMRQAKKVDVLARMTAAARSVRDISAFLQSKKEGCRLAAAVILQVKPRRTELSSLISLCRDTAHRFVWLQLCKAIVRHAESCPVTDREAARAVAELDAVKESRVYKDGRIARQALEAAVAALRR